jgi:murein DD-endopeptidase MepM/ murein hydrolase activator NlpD
LVEQQVFTTVMAGASLPVSARVGWGGTIDGSEGKGLLAPGSGVYIVDMMKDQAKVENVVPAPAHEETKADVGATNQSEPPKDNTLPVFEISDTKFPRDPLEAQFMSVISDVAVSRTVTTTDQNGKQTTKTGPHKGTDLAAPKGSRVFAVDAGEITSVNDSDTGSGGKSVTLKTTSGFIVTYLHLDSIKVSSPSTVIAGAEIAISGKTGQVTGPHLHVQIRRVDAPEGHYMRPMTMFPSGR